MIERGQHRSGAAVRDNEITGVERHGLRNMAFDVDVGRLRAERRWISVASNGQGQVDRLVTQRGDAFEQTRGFVESRSECCIHRLVLCQLV